MKRHMHTGPCVVHGIGLHRLCSHTSNVATLLAHEFVVVPPHTLAGWQSICKVPAVKVYKVVVALFILACAYQSPEHPTYLLYTLPRLTDVLKYTGVKVSICEPNVVCADCAICGVGNTS